MTKTYNRGTLKRALKNNLLIARCIGRYTDDYVYDAETNFGATDWMPAVYKEKITDEEIQEYLEQIKKEFDEHFIFDEPEYEQRRYAYRQINKEREIKNVISFEDSDLTTKSGSARIDENGLITLHVHSNLSYELKMKN